MFEPNSIKSLLNKRKSTKTKSSSLQQSPKDSNSPDGDY